MRPCLQEIVYDLTVGHPSSLNRGSSLLILTQSLGLAELSLRNAFASYDDSQARAAYYTERSGACPCGTGAGRGTWTPNILITSEAHCRCAIPAYHSANCIRKYISDTNRPSSYIRHSSILLTYTHGRLSNRWSVYASPMANQFIAVEPHLAFHYRAQNQYLENFTEFQHIIIKTCFFLPNSATLALLIVIHSLLSFKGNACFWDT